MLLKKIVVLGVLGIAAIPVVACSSDADSSGTGGEKFSTWGEEFVEDKIPAGDGESGFVDGWTVKYSKFLVNYHNITVADANGDVVAKTDKPFFVDNTKAGVKELMTFPNLEAKAYTKVTYEIKTAVAGETLIGGAEQADLDMMVANGWSFYAAGTATKGTATKSFKWGFKTQTIYQDCHSAEENGVSTIGVVVTNGKTDESQLTTHGDHLYYDALQSGDNARKTLIRFDEKAAADEAPNGNGDGEITLQELCKANIDPTIYNPSGLPVATIGDFVIELARTIGHYRGEGECTISRIDPKPASFQFPCDEYRTP